MFQILGFTFQSIWNTRQWPFSQCCQSTAANTAKMLWQALQKDLAAVQAAVLLKCNLHNSRIPAGIKRAIYSTPLASLSVWLAEGDQATKPAAQDTPTFVCKCYIWLVGTTQTLLLNFRFFPFLLILTIKHIHCSNAWGVHREHVTVTVDIKKLSVWMG